MTDPVVSIVTLPELLPGRHLLEGQDFGLGHLTLVLGESPPGQVAPLHRHDYEEIFIIHAGRGTYTLEPVMDLVGLGDGNERHPPHALSD
jgi:mannose-6-phosphate isomerase-like protein (cupin superfamily)